MKYYLDYNTVFNHRPHFVSGRNDSLNMNSYTDDIFLANFIVLNLPRSEIGSVSELFEEVKQLKTKNKNIKLILYWKDELIQESDELYQLAKKCINDSLFSKNEIIAFSPNINKIDYKYFIHTPIKFWAISYFRNGTNKNKNVVYLKNDLYPSDDGRYFGTKVVYDSKIQRTKKIISSARKWNPYRLKFYDELLKNHKHLINDNNFIRFYSLQANDNKDKIKYYDLFPHNKPLNELDRNLMSNQEEKFYEPIVKDYLSSYFTIVHETVFPDFEDENYLNQYHIGEKTGIPISTKTIFFHNTHSSINKRLNECGIETFDDIFGVEIDDLTTKKRIKKLLVICDRINNMTFDEIKQLYYSDEVRGKLDRNFNTLEYWRNPNNQKREVEEFLGKYL